ncbi:MAG: GNAT family N-acetyltransferase [Acidimicrobiia bacterium]
MASHGVIVRALAEHELADADRIMRMAFGTFLGIPDPSSFMGDADYVRTRWAADPSLALAAEVDGRLVGTNFVTGWGSVGFFGPLTVEPALWDQGVARALLDETMPVFDRCALSAAGLFTFGQSPKHVGLYQRYGFMPRFLTAVLARPPAAPGDAGSEPWSALSELADAEAVVAGCKEVTGAVYPGLDVSREVRAAATQKLGDTVVVPGDDGPVDAFAVCHTGPGTEAGSGACFVKFGAARPGDGAGARFDRLVRACEAFADARGAGVVVAGVSTARRGAYRALLERGYKAQLIGVTMHRPDEGPYHHDDAWVIDDWR